MLRVLTVKRKGRQATRNPREAGYSAAIRTVSGAASYGLNGGVADSLDDAKAFRTVWDGGLSSTVHPAEARQRLLSPEKAERNAQLEPICP